MARDHICVCVCTYRRPALLPGLLEALGHQFTDKRFTYSLAIVDNDADESAKHVVESYKREAQIDVGYYVEPRKGIPLARNKAIENAKGTHIAFIDDDEIPMQDWLYHLYRTCIEHKVDGVLGPVKPRFEQEPPGWITKAKLFERPSYETGKILEWYNTRTGNVLLRKNIFKDLDDPFNPKFRHSEDQEFFRRMTEKGYVFIWCDEAIVYETETVDRFEKSYFIKRALLRGNVSLRLRSRRLLAVAKSTIAFSIYTVALPFLLPLGQHVFFKYLIKDCDHIGRIMAALGIDMQRYLT